VSAERLVIDASVAIKWSLPAQTEVLIAEALRLLERYVAGEVDFVVPDIFWAEVGSVLWKGTRQLRWNRSQAEAFALSLSHRDFTTISSSRLVSEALRIAFAYERSVCDSLYVALAIQAKTQLITADQALANALAARLPVKWLGAIS
jgi:predicted nucleic acid-binding protein